MFDGNGLQHINQTVYIKGVSCSDAVFAIQVIIPNSFVKIALHMYIGHKKVIYSDEYTLLMKNLV